MKPLDGMIVLDFSQFLAGPSAALRLADLGARVIKIERPGSGDGSRKMTLHDLMSDGDSVLFQTINRNKESYCANLKDPHDLECVKNLIKKSDAMIENFRPGIMKKLGLDYESVHELNPKLVYGTVTGYGSTGPWIAKPGQDLLVQSLSGLAWLNGNTDQPPTPFALSVADSYTGIHLAEGILACLFRRLSTGEGGHVEVSLLESVIDMQFEVLTTYLNDGHQPPVRSSFNNAHAYLSAPYGIYETSDSYIALAMGSITDLGNYLESSKLQSYDDQQEWFEKRDEIKSIIADILKTNTTDHWVSLLRSHGYWCSEVLNWEQLLEHDAFKSLEFLQTIKRPDKHELIVSRCPISFQDGHVYSSKWAPELGEDTEKINQEFLLS